MFGGSEGFGWRWWWFELMWVVGGWIKRGEGVLVYEIVV